MTRYYLVEDQAIIDAIKNARVTINTAVDTANEFAKKHGVGDAQMFRDGIFGVTLGGFSLTYRDHMGLATGKLWTIPRDCRSRPKVNKKPLYLEYVELKKKVTYRAGDVHELLGWDNMQFFPSQPGFYFDPKNDVYVFLMPDACEKSNGCKEITNLEYLALKNEGDDDE